MVVGDNRAPVATFFVEDRLAAASTILLSERANHHARVKRMESGDVVRLVDGNGTAAIGTIRTSTKGTSEIDVSNAMLTPRPASIHVRVPVGDRDRMLWLAEKATELGVESWQAVLYHRSRSVSPRGEGEAFAEKVRARMISALEQSGGAWLPRILPDATPETIDTPADSTRVMLDVAGEALLSLAPANGVVITLGPEGGIEASERAVLAAAQWKPARLAATMLRFETAGVAAISVVRARQILQEN
jgi:16S rRNA (uracil1498-N3)-methyltransferase